MKAKKKVQLLVITVAVGALLVLGGCASSASSGKSGQSQASGSAAGSSRSAQPSGTSGQKPAPKENNPTGDIPDTQAFVTYKSTQGHYKLQVTEGWARTVKGPDVSFVSKLDGLSVSIQSSSGPPSVASVRKSVVPGPRTPRGRCALAA